MSHPLRRSLPWPETIGAAVLVAWPFVLSSGYDLRIFTLAGVYVLLVLGYQFIFGHAGALALTQGAFFGLAAYVTGVLGAKYGWGFAATFPLSIAAPVVLAALIAAPVLRLESHYFALATLGIAQVLLLVCVTWNSMTGGANGIPGVPPVRIGEITIGRGYPILLLVWGFAIAGALLSHHILRGAYGLAFHVARESRFAAAAIGLDSGRLRLTAFLLSAVYAGVAGALFVHTLGVISPDVLELPVMVACLAMTVVGGRTRLAGAFVGAVLLVHLPEWLRFLDKYYLIAYGALLLLMIVVAPDGLVGTFERLRSRLFPSRPLAPPIQPLAPRAAVQAGDGRLVDIRGIAKAFGGVRALDGVSFDIRRGEILGLIGPNGSGKTTLINVISGLYAPDSGEVRIAGSDPLRLRPFEIARQGVARTFQNLSLVDDMSALDNVAVARAAVGGLGLRAALRAARSDPALTRARGEAMFLLDQLGASGVALDLAGALAHGAKRRVEIARALALQPVLLLLDEPAAGLTDGEQRDLASRLRRLAHDGCTLVIVEHNMPFLMPLADRLVCLDHGQVIAAGSPAEIRAHPRVIEAYLGRRGAAA